MTNEQTGTPKAAQAAQASGDDRRTPVNPADHPAPNNPPVDEDAVRKGEETLERVKPY